MFKYLSADDWAVCAVDIPDAKCHWYVMAPDNTFGEGFDWESAPWFDANGLGDVAPRAKTVVENYDKGTYEQVVNISLGAVLGITYWNDRITFKPRE